jgi:hypothetical protein
MKTSNTGRRPELAPNTGSAVTRTPNPATQETELEQLKQRLLDQLLSEDHEPEFAALLRHAANEAASLAWATPYPLLVFPALFEEKVERALLQAERQDDIRQRSQELLFV